MDLVNLSQANNKYLITGENKAPQVGAQAQTQIQPQVQPQAQPQVQTEPVREESGDKKLLGALAALGAIAAAGVGIALAVKKGKNPAKALSDINFTSFCSIPYPQNCEYECCNVDTDYVQVQTLEVQVSLHSDCYSSTAKQECENTVGYMEC